MRILAVGDLIGQEGLRKLEQELPSLIKRENIDFVIVNGENVADGMGINEKSYKTILSLGADVVTLGNHTWAKKDVFNFIDDEKLVRPANYPDSNPGKGYGIYNCKDKKIGVINLIGRVTMNVLSENPFTTADKIINEIKDKVDYIVEKAHCGRKTVIRIQDAFFINIGGNNFRDRHIDTILHEVNFIKTNAHNLPNCHNKKNYSCWQYGRKVYV